MSYMFKEYVRKIWCVCFKHTRKNNKLAFYIKSFAQYALPRSLYLRRKDKILKEFYSLPKEEQNYIKGRVDYYCKFESDIFLPDDAPKLENFTFKKRESYVHDYVNSTYFFDAYEYIRYFPKHLKWAYNPGDVNYLFPLPEITKSRPISTDDTNKNNIILNLDRVRHFTWIYDPFKWEDKKCSILFRGDVTNKPHRVKFIEMWGKHHLCDVASGGNLSLYDHLRHRYIMALEGNDVASNLKWVMSSNSIAIMPRPSYETWYMEAKLIPNYHYIEISPDYSDLIERVTYYEEHPEEAKAIAEHAHEWTAQFRNKKREKIISILLLEKYFEKTGQTSTHLARHIAVNSVAKLNNSQKANAQSKARTDVAKTIDSLNFESYEIAVPKYQLSSEKRPHHYPFFSSYIAYRQAKKIADHVKEGDTVFIQDFHLAHMQLIAKRSLDKKAKVVFLVHDINSLRFSNKATDNEIQKLNNASLLIVHSEQMAKRLSQEGVTIPMRVLTLFDYYSTDHMLSASEIALHKSCIAFAGNIAKSTFIEKLRECNMGHDITFKLYGHCGGRELPDAKNIKYCGCFAPEHTSQLKAGWGLVWDGDSVESCSGDLGEYLRINASHKMSLYLSAGLPVIVWDDSAAAVFVKENNIGITVQRLCDIETQINQINEDSYREMITNAQMIGYKLREGHFLKEALKDI